MKNDNRNYKYSINSNTFREQYSNLFQWIPSGSHVIDLGCGDGSLLYMLKDRKVTGEGIELSKSGVLAAKEKGLIVKQDSIDKPLTYKNQSFDFAICNVTLQMVMYPEILLLEMKRIAVKQIVSFPNFAFFVNRFDLFFNGRMPKIMIPGYDWYSTGHIHQLSIRDFENFCSRNNMQILSQNHMYPKQLNFIPREILNKFPNIFATTAIFLTKSK